MLLFVKHILKKQNKKKQENFPFSDLWFRDSWVANLPHIYLRIYLCSCCYCPSCIFGFGHGPCPTRPGPTVRLSACADHPTAGQGHWRNEQTMWNRMFCVDKAFLLHTGRFVICFNLLSVLIYWILGFLINVWANIKHITWLFRTRLYQVNVNG